MPSSSAESFRPYDLFNKLELIEGRIVVLRHDALRPVAIAAPHRQAVSMNRIWSIPRN